MRSKCVQMRSKCVPNVFKCVQMHPNTLERLKQVAKWTNLAVKGHAGHNLLLQTPFHRYQAFSKVFPTCLDALEAFSKAKLAQVTQRNMGIG